VSAFHAVQGFRVQGSGFRDELRVQGSGFRDELRIQGSGFRDELRIQGSGFRDELRIQGSGDDKRWYLFLQAPNTLDPVVTLNPVP